MNDEFKKNLDYLYGWKVKGGKAVPPTKNYPLPDFVQRRVKWATAEYKNGLTFMGAIRMLLEIDNEQELKDKWEIGAMSDYMPVSAEYIEWLNDPIYSNIRCAAVIVAAIYD